MDFGGYRFKVMKAGNKMIESVLVQKLPREQPEEKKELVEEKNDAVSKEHQGDVS